MSEQQHTKTGGGKRQQQSPVRAMPSRSDLLRHRSDLLRHHRLSISGPWLRRGGHSALDDNERLAWGGCTRAGPECRQAQVGLLHEVQVAGPFLEPQLFERLVDDFYGRSITRQTQLHCQRVEFVLEVRHWGSLQAPAAATTATAGAQWGKSQRAVSCGIAIVCSSNM
eukprot:scaffold29504_cov66-Phaeocystis_antarctica.AAC.2